MSEAPLRRDTSRDGFRNSVENYLLGNFGGVWRFINKRPKLRTFVNRLIVDNAARKAPARPLALATAAPYVTWPALNDKTFFSRYLPPKTIPDLPSIDAVTDLFRHGPEGQRLSPRSTLLLPSFAQWFTDGFLMTESDNRRKTKTTHQVELNQLYGLTRATTDAVRLFSEEPGRRGRLKSEITETGEWAPALFDANGERKPEFAALPDPVKLPPGLPLELKRHIFAFGGERANSTLYTAAFNTLFLREHNRLAAMLEANNPGWDDERVFQTARIINIVLLITVVVDEYINHISPYWFRVMADPSPSYKAAWNRPNWIPVEFNLLYRWHSLVPEKTVWDGVPLDLGKMRFNHGPMLAAGLGAAFDSASRTPASRIGMFNTSDMLIDVEYASIQQGRENELASYNDYREVMQFPRVTRFEQISSDPRVVEGLRRVYGDVDKVEFFAGLFAEDVGGRGALPNLIGRMVSSDAFSHALTNPLLSPRVFNEETFTREGMAVIRETMTMRQLLDRNSGPMPVDHCRISMERDPDAEIALPDPPMPAAADGGSGRPGGY